jgi:hypothetical protein
MGVMSIRKFNRDEKTVSRDQRRKPDGRHIRTAVTNESNKSTTADDPERPIWKSTSSRISWSVLAHMHEHPLESADHRIRRVKKEPRTFFGKLIDFRIDRYPNVATISCFHDVRYPTRAFM